MIHILKKEKTRLRVKQVNLPAHESPILGVGVDVMTLPEGHACCSKCSGHLFECWVYGDNHRVELGCLQCGHPTRYLFPLDVDMPNKQGRFTCNRHPDKGMVLIHNIDIISIGCEKCYTEIDFKLKNKHGLIIPGDIN